MTLYSTGAHIGDNGLVSGGKAGDQTKTEVSTRIYKDYSKGWNGVLRYRGDEWERINNRMMKAAYRLGKYNKVGYDQNQRDTLYRQMQEQNWLLRNVNKIEPCETDCSAFMVVVANIAFVPLKKGKKLPDWLNTEFMVEYFTRYMGFKWIKSGINFKTGDGLFAGDILLNQRHHTEIFMGRNKSGTMYESAKMFKSNEEIAAEVLDGLWGNGATRKEMLESAGYDYKTIQRLVNKGANL